MTSEDLTRRDALARFGAALSIGLGVNALAMSQVSKGVHSAPNGSAMTIKFYSHEKGGNQLIHQVDVHEEVLGGTPERITQATIKLVAPASFTIKQKASNSVAFTIKLTNATAGSSFKLSSSFLKLDSSGLSYE